MMASCSHYTLDYRLDACNTSSKKPGFIFGDMHRENLIELENNAVIAFEEYGDANGVPVIFCHGWPSSRTMARLTDEPARDLGIRDFRMLGISGGAPYAYATAVALPERVRAIAIVGGAPPIAELGDFDELLPLYRWMLACYRTRPRLLRTLFYLARPVLSLRPPVRLRPLFLKMLLLRPCDAESLRDEAAFEAIFESQRRAWRASAEGVMADAQIYAQP